MSRVSPYDTAPQLIERAVDRIDMMVRDQPNVVAYRFWGAPTLNAAYGKPTASGMPGVAVTQAEAMFEVLKSRQFRSPSVIQRRWSWYGENLRGMSRVAWDPADYVGPATSFPGRDETWFVRVQERRYTAGWLEAQGVVDTGEPKLGSIYVVPPAPVFGQPQPGVSLAGTAPAGTGALAGAVPPFDPDMQVPNPMHIVLPRYTQSCFINNTGAANDLLCSTGWGLPMLLAGPNEDAIEFGGGIKEVVLAGSGGITTFDIYAVLALGPGG